MTALEFKDLKAVLPRQISDEMITTTKSLSTVAKLSNQEPMRFGEIDFISFTDTVRAEFVEESGDKSGTTAGWGKVTAVPPLGGSVEVSPPRQRRSILTFTHRRKISCMFHSGSVSPPAPRVFPVIATKNPEFSTKTRGNRVEDGT